MFWSPFTVQQRITVAELHEAEVSKSAASMLPDAVRVVIASCQPSLLPDGAACLVWSAWSTAMSICCRSA